MRDSKGVDVEWAGVYVPEGSMPRMRSTAVTRMNKWKVSFVDHKELPVYQAAQRVRAAKVDIVDNQND